MNTKTKKYLLLAGLIVVLAAVGYINFALGTGTGTDSSVAASSTDEIEGALQSDDLAVMSSESFDDFKAGRTNTRNTEIALLDSIINDTKSDAERIKEAQDRKIEIVDSMESESTIENLLVAAGFPDVIVTVKTGSVNVVLKATEISKEQAAQVLKIVQDETKEDAQNIKIILQK